MSANASQIIVYFHIEVAGYQQWYNINSDTTDTVQDDNPSKLFY